MSVEPSSPRVRLWVKLALLAALGIFGLTLVHLAAGRRIATRAIEREQVVLGRQIATLIAQDVAEPLLLGDAADASRIVAAAAEAHAVEYCFVTTSGEVVATSVSPVPESVIRARAPGNDAPMKLDYRGSEVLDVVAPVLDGTLGELRVGLSSSGVNGIRHDLAVNLGWLAVAIILVGAAAAFFVGRRVARPISDMLRAVDRFDPAQPDAVPEITADGSDEIAELAAHLNTMMRRLQAAHAEAEQALERSFAAERLAAIGALTAGVAHEVNNPLAGLKNCVRRFEKSEVPEPKRSVYLGHMRSSVERIESSIERLLDFSRPRPVTLQPTDVVRLGRDALEVANPLLVDRQIECVLEHNGISGTVIADRHQISQALLNLLLNAAYVTAAGGKIRVGLRARDGQYGIAVADQGPGIPPEIRDRIADPFFTTKPVGQGTGLGLAVTRAIVSAHGGELTFEFPERGGTVATIWLARADGEAARDAGAGRG